MPKVRGAAPPPG